MTSATILLLLIGFISLGFLVSTITTMASAKNSMKGIPEELRSNYSQEKYEESIRYTRIRANFSIISGSISYIIMLAFIYFNGFAWVNDQVLKFTEHPRLVGMMFFGVLFLGSDIINTPLQLYAQFGIEKKFGFNKMTVKLFFMDKIKSYILAAILGGGILYLLFYFLELFESDFWIYFWIAISIVILFINMFYTSLFVPLFNKLTPLEDGTLKQKITDYGKKVGFPIENIYVIDGSKRSTKANAFFSGIGKRKKIVLYDTLIKDLTEDEIVAVLAHEVGHYKKKHIIWSLIFTIIQFGAILYLSSKVIFMKELSEALTVIENSVHINLIVFSILLSPISMLLGIIGNIISRKNEYEADAYARDTFNGGLLVSALKKLSENNLSNLNPHPFDVFINYSHPPVYKRYRALLKR